MKYALLLLKMYVDNSHSVFLLKRLSLLRDHEELCDIELKVGDNGTCFSAHKVVLAAVSDYFKAMFSTKMEESFVKTIILHKTDEKSVSILIDFAYTGHISLSSINVQPLLVTANMLGIYQVVTACCNFLESQMHASNCLGFIEFAEIHSLHELKSSSLKFSVHNFLDLMNYDEYLHTNGNTLKLIISHDSLNVSCEEDIFYFIEQWVLYDKDSRIEVFYELFNEIRLDQLSTNFLSYLLFHSLFSTKAGYLSKLKINMFYNLKSSPSRMLSNELCLAKSKRNSSDCVFLSGGKDGLLNNLVSCTLYNLKKDTWIDCSPLPTPRINAAAVANNGVVYVVGGYIPYSTSFLPTSSMIKYSIYTHTWKYSLEMTEKRSGHVAVNSQGFIYVIGGYDGQSYLKSAERFSPSTEKWEKIKDMQYSRGAAAAVTLEEYIYVLGGQGIAHLSSVERYNTISGQWELMPAMSCKRINFGAAQVNGYIFVVGGHDGTNYLRSMERFDPISNEWAVVSSMSSPRTGIGVSVLYKKLYVMGGHNGSRYLDTCCSYDPFTDKWEDICSMNTPRCYMSYTDVCLNFSS
ncbi:kelch-like protein 28 isoform X1 [Hydra vulgaris]|uniref:kelch-like protein 28 isoform X1 n=1 Tax=Hydra vulgaris TaxID=6087 RepID=UPI0002B44D65